MQFSAEHEGSDRTARVLSLTAADRPACQDLGKAGDIGLRVAAINAERVQFQNLAREILIQAKCSAARGGPTPCDRIRSHRLLVVQVQQHRRMRLDREQQVVKSSHDMRSDRLALETARDAKHRGLVDRDREMIAPEIHQPLDEWPVALQCRSHPREPFALIDRAQVLRQTLCEIGDGRRISRVRAALGAASFTLCAHDRRGAGEDLLGALQPLGRQERCTVFELMPQPASGIGADGLELTRPCAQSETIRSNGSGNINAQRALLEERSRPVQLQRAKGRGVDRRRGPMVPWYRSGTVIQSAESIEYRMSNPIYLEELPPGRRFTTQSQVIAQPEIQAFAAEFDPQPFHLDPEAASESVFGGLVASGWHIAAITMRLLLTSGSARPR